MVLGQSCDKNESKFFWFVTIKEYWWNALRCYRRQKFRNRNIFLLLSLMKCSRTFKRKWYKTEINSIIILKGVLINSTACGCQAICYYLNIFISECLFLRHILLKLIYLHFVKDKFTILCRMFLYWLWRFSYIFFNLISKILILRKQIKNVIFVVKIIKKSSFSFIYFHFHKMCYLNRGIFFFFFSFF